MKTTENVDTNSNLQSFFFRDQIFFLRKTNPIWKEDFRLTNFRQKIAREE